MVRSRIHLGPTIGHFSTTRQAIHQPLSLQPTVIVQHQKRQTYLLLTLLLVYLQRDKTFTRQLVESKNNRI